MKVTSNWRMWLGLKELFWMSWKPALVIVWVYYGIYLLTR